LDRVGDVSGVSGTDSTGCALQVDTASSDENDSVSTDQDMTHVSSVARPVCQTAHVFATVLVARLHVDLQRTASATCSL
jgi:hypothetical protein